MHSAGLTGADIVYKLVVQLDTAQVKIEVLPVMRGVVEPICLLETSSNTQAHFGYAEIPVVAFNDLYAGNLCAALSRLHPRDLYDVMVLLKNEGISPELLEVFIVYLLSARRLLIQKEREQLTPDQRGVSSEFQAG